MNNIKLNNKSIAEILILACSYIAILVNVIILKDSIPAAISAFFGITYTLLAGKGIPACYLFGITGSGFYGYLAFCNALWGNLILYIGYYAPMQILGFFRWNKHLKKNKNEIIKTKLNVKEGITLALIVILACIISVIALYSTGDKNPVIDGITTVLSVAGMLLTVKRCIEQWIVWMIVNGLSAYMWLDIALKGEKVYSTVLMWSIYFFLAIWFYISWKREISGEKVSKT